MESEKRERRSPYPVKVSKLSLKEKLMVRILGYYLAFYDNKNFSKPMPIYMAKCKIHGYFLDYLHGYDDRLDCPECSKIFYEQLVAQRKPCEQLVMP